MNKSAWVGIGLALGGISVGLYLDGGKVGQLLQPNAALIVFGGTLGAVMVQFPFSVLLEAVRQIKVAFSNTPDPAPRLIEELTRYAVRARRGGLLSLDADLQLISDHFMRKALTLAVDGIDASELRLRMELEMDSEADREDLIPKVFEAAGGFAPTIGILGAVIGLIQVMQKLENINEVGKGIAIAFVATIYGVGVANIIFLPLAGRIRMLMRRKQVLREMMLEGVIAIMDKTNPRSLEAKLAPYRHTSTRTPSAKLVAV